MEITKKSFINFTRIFDIPQYQQEKYPNATALNNFADGQWRGHSIQELQTRIDAISAWFLTQGYLKEDKIILVPIMGSVDWMVLDFACQQVGIVVVPLHPTSRPEEIKLILNETEAKLIIAADVEIYEKFLPLASRSQKPIPIHNLTPHAVGFFQPIHLTNVSPEMLARVTQAKKGIDEHDVFTILYTSGSSGMPKGVMLTHHNVVHNIKAILTILPLEPMHRVLSFLPFSHIFERATCYAYMAFGVSLYFSQNKETFSHDFNTVKPYFCTSVPRVLEKMFDFMQEQQLHQQWLKKRVIQWAMEVGKKYEVGNVRPVFTMQLLLARILVLNQWRKMLGGKIRYITVGAASLRPEIGRLFSAAGIRVVEGYGMTETAPLITTNRFEPGMNRFGTVGMAVAGIAIRLDQPNEEGEGEILVKGPNVMPGYYKNPLLTKEAFTEDGWFRTGDIGKFVHQRFLQITDRKKDIFKTSAGKYIAPLPLQNHFTNSPFIQRCLIIGFQRPFVTCLVVPHFPMLEAWCKENDIHWTSPQFMVHNIKVRAKMQNEIDQLNEDLPNFQRVRNFVICHEEWTVERGEITNTLKPVRHLLVEHYKVEIEKMYS